MSENNYWGRVTSGRLSRRRALGGAAAIGAGAAALSMVGCGGNGSSSSSSSGGAQNTGLATKPADSTSSAKAGGTFKTYQVSDITTMDPIASTSFTAKLYLANYCYSRLVKFKMGIYPDSATGEVEGDSMEAWELSPDKTQVTMHLRQGMKWDSRAPTSGRPVDAQDVVFSLDRFSKVNPQRGDVIYNAAQGLAGSLESWSATDNKTVVLKLHQPDAGFLPNLAAYQTFWVMPRESDGGFDPKGVARGYGPWILADYQPSASFSWTKNPDYYVKGLPYADKLDQPIVTEYATQLAEFKAGNIWNSVVTQDDVIQTKKDAPATLIYQADSYATGGVSLGFGYSGDSPFKDQRVRQAVNYLVDRETFIDTIGNRQKFVDAGLPLSARYHTMVGAGWEGYWVDPLDDKKFGDTSKYFKLNIPEAKKLLTAAGFANGLDTTLFFNGSTNYGATYTREAQIFAGMLNDGGMRTKQGAQEYQNDWLPNYHFIYTKSQPGHDASKGFSGMAYRAPTFYATLAQSLFTNQHKDGSRFEGCTPDGKNPDQGDPQLNSLIEGLRNEFDLNAARSKALDIARFMADKAYFIQGVPFGALSFSLPWPVIGNYGAFRSWTTTPSIPESVLHWWIDTSKPPIAKS